MRSSSRPISVDAQVLGQVGGDGEFAAVERGVAPADHPVAGDDLEGDEVAPGTADVDVDLVDGHGFLSLWQLGFALSHRGLRVGQVAAVQSLAQTAAISADRVYRPSITMIGMGLPVTAATHAATTTGPIRRWRSRRRSLGRRR